MKRIALLLLLVLTAVATWSRDNVPDFNYPKQVTQQAESDLKKALSKGDGQQVVDAIVRVSIAQSQLSREEMSKIIDLIERTVSNENDPAIRALLRHFEAVVMRSYCASFISIDRRGDDDIRIYDPNPGARQRDPYAQWTTDQFTNRIDELVLASLADSAVLCSRPVTDFPRIIKCDKLGASYVPTLYQFLIKENLSLASSDVKKQLQQRWVWSTSDNLVANVWTRKRLINENYSGSYRSRALEIIAEHPDAEINGLLLEDMSDDSDYKMLCDYVSRYPKSRYTPDVRNNIANIERTSVNVTNRGQWNSRDSLSLLVNVRNVKQFDIDIYRLTDDMCSPNWKGDRFKVGEMARVATQAVSAPGTVP